tara:strand:- start:795 stop:1127 length:333 start_codon:yes stop_codon:yes gene_type:complete
MSITHTVGITSLQIVNDSDNVISSVFVSIASSDSSNPTGTLKTVLEPVGLNTTNGASATGFVTYTNLTESEVLSWSDISNHIVATKEKNEIFINEKLNFIPSHISKELPW